MRKWSGHGWRPTYDRYTSSASCRYSLDLSQTLVQHDSIKTQINRARERRVMRKNHWKVRTDYIGKKRNLTWKKFCIGCGATIRRQTRLVLASPPSQHLKKRFGDWWSLLPTLFSSPPLQWNRTDVQLTDDDSQTLARGGETVMLWWSMSLISLTLMALCHPGLPRFVSGNDVLLVGNKKDILPKSVKPGKISDGSWNVPTKKDFVLLMSSWLQPKTSMPSGSHDKIEHYRKGRDVYVVGVTTLENQPSSMPLFKNNRWQNVIDFSFPRDNLGQIEIPLDDGSYITIHRESFIATRWPTTWWLKPQVCQP